MQACILHHIEWHCSAMNLPCIKLELKQIYILGQVMHNKRCRQRCSLYSPIQSGNMKKFQCYHAEFPHFTRVLRILDSHGAKITKNRAPWHIFEAFLTKSDITLQAGLSCISNQLASWHLSVKSEHYDQSSQQIIESCHLTCQLGALTEENTRKHLLI